MWTQQRGGDVREDWGKFYYEELLERHGEKLYNTMLFNFYIFPEIVRAIKITNDQVNPRRTSSKRGRDGICIQYCNHTT
jgi:hypothetical protein